jgi:peptide/nickel transport system substrate-binding protein
MQGGSVAVRNAVRRRRGVVLVTALALVLVACSGSSGSSSGGSANANGTLRYGYALDAQFTDHFDPAKSTGNCDAIVIQQIYDTLLHRDAAGNLLPGLVQKWDIASDGMSVTFHLRPGVRFQDGTAFDANAVRVGLLHNQPNPQLTSLLLIDHIDVVDPTTVKIALKKAAPLNFLYAMTSRDGMIVSSAALNTADKQPVGAGPFRFTGYQPGSKISVTRFPEYWGNDQWKIRAIDFTQVGTGPPAVTALKSGALDFIRFEAESYGGLKSSPNIGVAVQPTGSYLQFQFRFDKPFDDIRVRQAFNYAIDRKQINEIVNAGQGEVASQTYPKSSPGYDPSLANVYSYDPAKARQLLADAGYPNGLTIEMVIPGGNIANMERQGALLQQQLQAVGVTPKVTRINGSDIATNYYQQRKGNAFAAARLNDPYLINQIWNAYGKGEFVAIYTNQERQDITDLANQAFRETDTQKYNAIVKQASKIVVDQALEVPIAFTPQFVAYDKARVGGTVKAQTDICDVPDLTGVTVKG